MLGMYLALVASLLGSFTASALIYIKIMIHDIIFSALSVIIDIIQGGIVYSSSSDLQPNPAVPLTCGFVMSFAMTFYHAFAQKKWNDRSFSVSLSHLGRFAIPGIFCGSLSGVLQAIYQGQF
jgi:hypothetical protein